MVGGAVVVRNRKVWRQGAYVVAAGQGAQTRNGMMSSATMFATLIIGLIAGPAVSL
jgi:hypothetical protein